MGLNTQPRAGNRGMWPSAALVCCALLFLGFARNNAFSLPQDYSSQSTVKSDSTHPNQFIDGGEQPLSSPTEAYVLLPQLASLRLSLSAEASVPLLHASRPDANRAPPLS
jgi:hypothetical protein